MDRLASGATTGSGGSAPPRLLLVISRPSRSGGAAHRVRVDPAAEAVLGCTCRAGASGRVCWAQISVAEHLVRRARHGLRAAHSWEAAGEAPTRLVALRAQHTALMRRRTTCPHCGAAMREVIAIRRPGAATYGETWWVCSDGWDAPWLPPARRHACGASRSQGGAA